MVKNRISSQHLFGYQKFILYPEDYKPTKSNRISSLQRQSSVEEVEDNSVMVHHQHDEVSASKHACGQKDFPHPEGFLFYGIKVGDPPAGC